MTLDYRISRGLAAIKHLTSIYSAATKIRLGILVILLGLASSCLFAATTGSISGTVTDPQGAVIPNTKVDLRDTLTGVIQTIVTDSAGFYSFPSLALGHYDVTFEKDGFEKFVQKDVVIDVDSARRVDATLKPGSVQEQITVTSTEAQVDTETAQMGEVITSKEISDIPLNGRAYTDLLPLQPGVVPIQTQMYSTITPSNSDNDGLGSMSGAQDVHNGFVVNGANVVDGAGEGTFLIPNLDSIAEFRIVTNNGDAEYGGYAGGLVNVVTKSGTNNFHGDAFEYFRNGKLNASQLFGGGRPSLVQNIYGGTVGGPIIHNKIFFFGDYQGRRSRNGSPFIADVPSDADRTGDLSDETGNFVNNPRTVQTPFMATLLSNRMGTTVQQGEPYFFAGCTSNDPNTGCVFPGNATAVGPIIPQSAWDPVAVKLLQFIPKQDTTDPNSGKAAYQVNNNNTYLRDDKGAIRVDANTRFGNLSGYYHLNPWDNPSPPSFGNAAPGFTNDYTGKAQLWVAALTTTFGSSAVNTFTASYTRNKNIQGGTNSGAGTTLASIGFASPANGGPYEEASGQFQNWPTFGGAFGVGIGPAVALVTQYNNIYGGQEDFSRIINTHTLKVGADYSWQQVDLAHANNGSNGDFSFGNNTTGSAFGDTMIGTPSYFAQGAPSQENLRTFFAGIYGEDSWRVTHNLTVKYGVRWEVNPWWREEHNMNAMALLGVQSTVFPGAPLGFVFPGDAGVPTHMANINWHDFAPRIGLAYAPDFTNPALHAIFGGHGKSSVRAAYGMYYTNIEGYNTFNFSSPPYHYFDQVTSGDLLSQPFIGQDGSTLSNPFPLTAFSNPKAVNWAPFLPIATLRNPIVHEASPYEEHFDLSFERELSSKTLLSLSYVGTFGHHLTVVANGNPGDPALCLSLSQSSEVMPGTRTCGPGGENKTYSPVAGGQVNGTRGPFGDNFQSIGDLLDVGNSSYNALFATLRHTTERLSVLVSYTRSKSFDNGSGRGDLIWANDPNHFRGLSIYDVPNNFATSYGYELPFDMLVHGHDRVFRGWRISGETQFTGGVPVWMTDGSSDNNLRGDKKISAWGFTTDEPVMAQGPLYGGGIDRNLRHPNAAWFNYNLFSEEPVGTQGNTPRRFFHQPGIDNTNLRLAKSVKIKEAMSAELQAEFFDVFNHASFSAFNGVCGDFYDCGLPSFNSQGQNTGGNFGQWIGGSPQARIGELVAKFTF